MAKGILIIGFALFIDGLQAALALMFVSAGAVLGVVPLIGAVGMPLGIGLGFASDICISLMLGSALIFLLAINGMYYPGYTWAVFIGETIPGLDIIPGWTFLAISCVLKKNAETKSGVVGFASSIASAALSPTSAASGLGRIAAGIVNSKTAARSIVERAPDMQTPDQSEPGQKIAAERQHLVADVGREITRPAPTNVPKSYAQA